MKSICKTRSLLLIPISLLTFLACRRGDIAPSQEMINAIDLKRGDVMLCASGGGQLGSVDFITSCSEKAKTDFNLAISLLHSFEYDEAEKVFAKIIDEDPACSMAYWGVAMCNYHQLWPAPPTQAELEKGNKAIAVAMTLPKKSRRETEYINAIGAFYKDWKEIDHRTRSVSLARAMEQIYRDYPTDKEAAVFYALSLVGSADPADKSYFNQKKAGDILNSLYPGEPDHPGIVHYIIHTYDYPELAELALPAAKKYASIAPASAHAQHMPSHIFIRLGLWDDAIQSNLTSTASAKCYAENAGIKGHWDEELHGMDYLVYAYLQKGENNLAKEQYDYLATMQEVYPVNFKVAYAFAAIPARYFLENKMWKEAAELKFHPENFPWQKFPWEKAIVHFTRLLGFVHTNKGDSARNELKTLQTLHDALIVKNDTYKANQVMIQIKAGEAWILFNEGKRNEALEMMKTAADMEDKTEKSPVTPGEVLPAEELLADMLMALNKPDDALRSYEKDLLKHPKRFNGLYGAATASEKVHDVEKAKSFYSQLLTTANSPGSNRVELEKAKFFWQEVNR